MFGQSRSPGGLMTRQTMAMRNRKVYQSPTNRQSADEQYEKEMRRLRAKQQKFRNLSETRRVAICGGKDEIVEKRQQFKRDVDKQLAKKKVMDFDERREDKERMMNAVSNENAIFEREEKRKKEKREEMIRMMEENKRLVRMKRLKQREARDEEKKTTSNDVEFFDRYKNYL